MKIPTPSQRLSFCLIAALLFAFCQTTSLRADDPAPEVSPAAGNLVSDNPVSNDNNAPPQDEDVLRLLEQARKSATARVAPSIVRIETIGGLETVDNVRIGAGPTTGLIVSDDGYIVSSAFNFAQKPASILIGLPDGTRVPAEFVARDSNRMLVLLKLQDVPEGIVAPEAAPMEETKVGQWAFALGKTYDAIPPALPEPNVSQGIISATDRIWGRAIQTDAKVSPVNYGGPLIDLQGRVLGILVPLSPQGSGDVAGYEWYDSGIGFAIPLEHVLNILPRWKSGEDLQPGILGINMSPGNQYADAAVVAVVRPNSPAAKAGWKAGDKILEISGKAIERQTQVREALGPFYAGDTIDVVLERDDERIESQVTLVDKLETYARPFLGMLPQRQLADVASEDEEPAEESAATGVAVRFVYADSPAQAAGFESGDVIVKAGEREITDINSLRQAVAEMQPSGEVDFTVLRGEDELTLSASLAAMTETIPETIPTAIPDRDAYVGAQPPVGVQHLKIPELENDSVVYVPTNYDPRVPYGVVVYFHEPGMLNSEEQEQELVERWRELSEDKDIILVAPKSRDPVRWQPSVDADFVAKLVEKVRQDYHVDDQRIIAHGYKGGAAFAYAMAFTQRQVFRGVAAIEANVAGRPPEPDPAFPLAFFVTTFEEAPNLRNLEQAFTALRGLKYPVTVLELGEKARYLTAEELEQLVRWLDSLDRI